MLKFSYAFIIILIIGINGYGQVYPTNVQFPSSIEAFNKFEISIQLNQTSFTNFYDPNVISVSTEFLPPTGPSILVNGFYLKEFSRCVSCPDPTVSSDPCSRDKDKLDNAYLIPQIDATPWRVRFSPNKAGTWQFRIKVIYNNGSPNIGGWSSFNVSTSSKQHPGYVGISAQTDPLFPLQNDPLKLTS